MGSNAFVLVDADADVRNAVQDACARAGCGVASGGDSLPSALEQYAPACVVLGLADREQQARRAIQVLAGARYLGMVLPVAGGDRITLDQIVDEGRSCGLKMGPPLSWPASQTSVECALNAALGEASAIGPDDLAYALKAGHVVPFFQPKFDLSRGAFVSVEALVRLRHPLRGLVNPSEFIPMAEQAGLIDPMTWLMLRESCRQVLAWQRGGLTVSVAVNVSPRLLTDPTFVDRLLESTSGCGMDPSRLVLEVTESAMLEGADAMETLRRIRARGFGLSLDDFGTGFSSLSRLYHSPFTELKIDQSFMIDIEARHEARVMVESSVSLAHRLGLSACAEGVETESAWNALLAMGCDTAQGFLMSRPLPAEDIPGFAQSWRSNVLARAPRARPKQPAEGLPESLAPLWEELHSAMDCPVAAGLTVGPADMTVILSDRTMLASEFRDGAVTSVRAAVDERKALQNLREPLGAGRPYEAIAACEALSDLLRGVEAVEALEVAERLRAAIERDLLFSSDSVIEFVDQQIVLLRRDVVSVGRPAPGIPVDVPIRCKYLSRADRQMRIGLEASHYWVEDLGSTNGITLHGARIPAGRRITFDALEAETVLGLGGSQGRRQSPCRLRLRRLGESLVVTVEAGQPGQSDDTLDLTSAWPTREQDCSRTWVLLRGTIGLGNGPDCAIPVPGAPAGRLAELSCDGGYRLKPIHAGAITMNGAGLRRAAAVSPETEIGLCGVRFLFRAAGLPEARVDRLSA